MCYESKWFHVDFKWAAQPLHVKYSAHLQAKASTNPWWRVWEESKVVDVRVTDGGGGWRRGKAYRFALQRLCSDALCGRNRPALGRKGVLTERERKAQWSHEHWNGPLCWREHYTHSLTRNLTTKEVITRLDKKKHNCVFIQSPKNICEQHSDIKSIKWADIEMQGSVVYDYHIINLK